jgi:hypothetical protein
LGQPHDFTGGIDLVGKAYRRGGRFGHVQNAPRAM